MSTTSVFASSFNERKWIAEISKILEKEVKLEIDIPVSIFRVPKNMSDFKPQAYEPQLIGLGPYHHFQDELYEMEKYKLAAASRVQNEFQGLEFKQLVEKVMKLEHKIRACYHKYLDFQGDTLAWIMAIDGLFLLDFLAKFVKNMDDPSSSSITAQLIDSSGKKLNHDQVLGDILMLENQIPIFLLSKILSIQCSLLEISNNMLPTILYGFCKSLSPLKLENDLSLSEVCNYAHLLDLLYHMIVPKLEGTQDLNYALRFSDNTSNVNSNSSKSHQVFTKLCGKLSSVNLDGVLSKITKPMMEVRDKVKKVITSIMPGISFLASKKGKPIMEEEDDGENTTPKVEKIMIPSVSYLSDVGVVFSPSFGGISTVRFDQETKIFYLPVLRLNAISEIVMRNLVAYEASAMPDALVYTRYTDLLSGMIETVEDATMLRERKIIVNSLKSDADVAELFHGMSRSVRLTKVPFIDKAIEDVKKYFYNTPKVRIYMRVKSCVHGSWQILTILAVILLMLLTGFQSFCSVYSCPKLFKTAILDQ